MFVFILIPVARRFAQAGRLADKRLVYMLPERARVHEHLVIETRRQEPPKVFIDGTYIKFKIWPVVLAFAGQPLKKLGRGGTLVRLKTGPFAHVEQSVGFFHTAGHNATRAVVFERSAHHHLVVGQQGRGQRVTRAALKALAVEREGN